MTSTIRGERVLARLATGAAEPVLVADFQPFSAAPRLSRLLADIAHGRPVYQFDPVGALTGDQLYLSLPELAAECAEAFLAAGPADRGVFVVGDCSAAALSLHIAKLLHSTRRVTVVLVQPTWPGEEYLRHQFADFQSNLRAAHRPCPELAGDPRRAVARMEEILRDELAAMAASQGLDASADAFTDLLASYRAWLAFLLACQNDPPIGWPAGSATVKVLTDGQGGGGVGGLAPDAYQISPLPIVDQANPVTPELAELVLTQLAGH